MLIRVGFSTSKGLIPRAVRFFTRSKISHTFLIIEDSFFGLDMVLEASLKGLHLTTLAQFERENTILDIISLKCDISSGLKHFLRFLGRSYDYLGIFGILLVILGRLVRLRLSNPFNTKALFCSELIVKVLQHSKYPGSESLNAATVSPHDLHTFLKKL